jgi:very-short-patch-repair endonuclease
VGELIRIRSVVELLPRIFSARMNLLERAQLDQRLNDLVRNIELCVTPEGLSVAFLRDAAAKRDPESYAAAFERIVALHGLRDDLQRRRILLEHLSTAAPGWAAAITRRDPPHDGYTMPGDPKSAWLWRQLHDELDLRAKVSIDELQRTVDEIESQLTDVTADLIDRRAWFEQLGRTRTAQRQALIGWLDTIKRIGKGTGKRVPRLLEEAKRLMNESRGAVPVWIMPLARVVDNFDARTTRFDVLIIDEASQCDVMGLIAVFMAKQVVIVGDHQQVSPDAVGQRLDQVQHLIDTHLAGIPNAHLYDGQMSVYDLARQSFGGLICLREHYRCVPDIIQFSNMLSYDWQIKPLRDPATTALDPHVVAHRVDGRREENRKTNPIEADHICALLHACIEQPEYHGKTFGVISLLGEEQAALIESQLRGRLSPAELTRRRLLSGNAAHFQGDERDVMFLSLVDSVVDGLLAISDRESSRKRYNVAASRAKDQMWVVHSLNPETDLKPGDLRRRLIQYAIDPASHVSAAAQQERRTESEFEKQVFRRLTGAGYRVIAQKEVGYYRIDLVVEGGGKQLAVECDGDRYHPIEKLAADMERQSVLQRLGWRFVRLRGSQFFRDPDSAMVPVFARLETLDIPREGLSGSLTARTSPDRTDALLDRVRRRAAAIQAQWREEATAEAGNSVASQNSSAAASA